jgi:hypothetical protein
MLVFFRDHVSAHTLEAPQDIVHHIPFGRNAVPERPNCHSENTEQMTPDPNATLPYMGFILGIGIYRASC